MNSAHDEVFALLDEYAGGETPLLPSREVITAGVRQRRRNRAAIGGIALAVAAVVTVGSVLVTGGTGGNKQHIATGTPLNEPTAQQLAHGHWVRIPKAPIKTCDPLTVSDGTGVIVVEYGYPPCNRGAARYNPATNSWSRIATPPVELETPPALAWGGGRLVSVSPDNTTLVWTPATNKWTKVQSLPAHSARSIQTLTWSGEDFVALSIGNGNLYTYRLDSSGKWSAMTTLVAPGNGQALLAAATTLNGSVYAIVSTDNPGSTGPGTDDQSIVLRYQDGGWFQLSLNNTKLPLSQLSLTAADGQVIASGSMCPAEASCTLEDAVTAVIRFPNQVRQIHPPHVGAMPYPSDVTAGGHALFASYVEGVGTMAPPSDFPTGEIYDLSTRTWLHAPTDRAVQGTSATWTSGGVVLISPNHDDGEGRTTSWLLAPKFTPAPRPSTSSRSTGSVGYIAPGEASPGCRVLPQSVAARRPIPKPTRLSATMYLADQKITLRPAPPNFQPRVSALGAYRGSALSDEPGIDISVFLARVSAPLPQTKHGREFHGQVFWVVRGSRSANPFQGLPGSITASDRRCASQKPPTAIVSGN
jgi:hypothetical protein